MSETGPTAEQLVRNAIDAALECGKSGKYWEETVDTRTAALAAARALQQENEKLRIEVRAMRTTILRYYDEAVETGKDYRLVAVTERFAEGIRAALLGKDGTHG
jgi:hypothetical protein